MLVLLAVLALQAAPQEALRVQTGIAVRPDTVTVGQPFQLIVRVRATSGASITFQPGPDSTYRVEALESPVVRSIPGDDAVEQVAVYRLAAWDVGHMPIALDEPLVRLGSVERRVPTAGLTVFVRSVLPADSSLHVPKPARSIFEFGPPWWWWLIALLVALAIIALLTWLYWRHRRRRRLAVTPENAFEVAEREFNRVEAMGLVEAGERGRHVALMVEVMRDYLAARFAEVQPSQTTSELLHAVHGIDAIPPARVREVLEAADVIKFGRGPVSAERARDLGREARSIVQATERQVASAAAAVLEAA